MKIELAGKLIDYRDQVEQEKIIARLRAEREGTEVNYFQEGVQFGYGWAQHSHYIEIQYVLSWNPETSLGDEVINEICFSEIDELDDCKIFCPTNGYIVSLPCQNFSGLNEGGFKRGFKAGVEKYWEKVKDAIIERSSMNAERSENAATSMKFIATAF